MITKKHGSYHLRKVVPEPLRHAVGQREIWICLGDSKRLATAKAGILYMHIESLFSFLRSGGQLSDKFNLKKYLIKMAENHPSDFDNFYDEKTAQIKIQKDFLHTPNPSLISHFVANVDARNAYLLAEIKRLNEELIISKHTGNSEKETELLNMLNKTVDKLSTSSISPVAVVPKIKEEGKTVTFNEISNKFMTIKKAILTLETYNHFDVAFRLFKKIYDGNRSIPSFTRNEAFKFIEKIKYLPKTHGKSCYDLDRDIDEIIKIAQNKNKYYNTISKQVITRHVNQLKALWEYTYSNGEVKKPDVDYNIWEKHFIIPVRENTNDRYPFTDDELLKMMSTRWNARDNINTSRQMIAVASYTGMRLEEICRLRPRDIRKINNILCFDICEHFDKDNNLVWDPKTEAGARFIPLHPYLKSDEVGLLERAENCQKSGKDRIFYDEKYYAKLKKYGASFTKKFSRFKKSAGLTEHTTFHSFRHLVRGKLGNRENLENYPTEWIDQILGHESAGEGQNYNKLGTTADNLLRVIKTISYNKDIWDPMKISNR